jgi:predicted glycoside hydrolase/deacetylase ChbG (UPF0249 family)
MNEVQQISNASCPSVWMTSVAGEAFGTARETDDRIVRQAADGSLGAIGVLVTAPDFDPHRLERLLHEAPRAALGIVLSLTDTLPLSDALRGTPWMCGEAFAPEPPSSVRFLRRKVPFAAIVEEWCAQTEYLQSITGRVDYLDSRRRVHLMPGLIAAALEVGDVLDISQIAVYPHESAGGMLRTFCERRSRRKIPLENRFSLVTAAH